MYYNDTQDITIKTQPKKQGGFFGVYDPQYEEVDLDNAPNDIAEQEAFDREQAAAEAYADEYGFPEGERPAWLDDESEDMSNSFFSPHGTSAMAKPAPRKIINPFIHLDDEPRVESEPTDTSPVHTFEIVAAPTASELSMSNAIMPAHRAAALMSTLDNSARETLATQTSHPTPPKTTPFSIMRRFVEQHAVLVIRGELYIYATNYYRRLLKDDAKTMISTFCHSIVGEEVTTRLVSEVLGQLRAYAPVIDNEAIVDDSLIASTNGLYDLRNSSFIAHLPTQRCFHFLPYRIDPAFVGEQFCPKFTAFLNSVTGGNPALIQRLWELTAILLTPMRIKCLPTLFGPPSSGKSVYISLIKKLHAHGDCFPLTFDRLTDRFSLSYAATANLITYFDIPNKRLSAKETAMLKSLCSTEDDIAVEAKSGAVSSLSSSRLKVLLASNFALRSYTRDEAFEERLTYFVFPNAISKKERVEHLSDLLAREGNAIVSTAILRYLPQILASNFHFSGEAETAKLFDKMTNSLPEDENIVLYDFIYRCIEDVPENKVATGELYTAFTVFCGDYPVFESDRKFSEAFAKAMGERATKCRVLVNGKSVNGYRGIRLKPANPQDNSCII